VSFFKGKILVSLLQSTINKDIYTMMMNQDWSLLAQNPQIVGLKIGSISKH